MFIFLLQIEAKKNAKMSRDITYINGNLLDIFYSSNYRLDIIWK